MRNLSSLLGASALAFCCATTALAGDKAMIVMDASGSMWGQIDGKTKIEIARETLGDVLQSLPQDLELGLMAYGHREKGQCSDIQTIVAPGPNTARVIGAAVNKLNPKGKTPLAEAVTMAAERLRYTEDKATVILITDGLETCDADPCAVANSLEQNGIDFTAHVVGFGLSKEEGQQVACIAQNTGGIYKEAKDAGALTEALRQTVAIAPPAPPAPKPKPEPQPIALENNVKLTAVFTEGGEAIDKNGRFDFFALEGETPAAKPVKGGYEDVVVATLDPGRYLMRYKVDGVKAETIVDVKVGEQIDRDLVLNAGLLKLDVAPQEGADRLDGAAINVEIGGAKAIQYGQFQYILPAGSGKVRTKSGRATGEFDIALKAGETLEETLIMGAGVLTVQSFYSDGGPEAFDNAGFEVLSAKKDIQGKRKSFEKQYGGLQVTLSPGDYVVRGTIGRAMVESEPVTVEANAMSEATIVFNAGVIAVAAPGARRIDILSAKTDINGKRKTLNTSYGEALDLALPAGEYLARVDYEDKTVDPKESTFVVTGGERTEVSVQ